jgi:D-lactate dehydrogenase
MHMSFFEVKDWERAYLSERLPADHCDFASEILSTLPKESSEIEALSVFIYSRVTREVLDALPALKIIATRSTGFDHIDVQTCRSRGIAVCNVPSYGEIRLRNTQLHSC